MHSIYKKRLPNAYYYVVCVSVYVYDMRYDHPNKYCIAKS